MNYLKAVKNILFLVSISFNACAELTAYTATYDVYSRGFHVGDATQTLEQLDDNWRITLHTEAVGFASFLQNKPIIQEHIFKLYLQQPLLLSAKSDSGKSEKNAKKSAYYDQATKQLFIKIGDLSKTLQMKQSLSSYLALPATVSNMQRNHLQKISLYEKGKVEEKDISYRGILNGFEVIEVTHKNSSKKLRYLFKPNNMQVPFRIEKYKKDVLKAYMELNKFLLNKN